MRTQRTLIAVKVAAILAMAMLATAAWAGAKYSAPVVVNLSSREAYGSMGSARNSGDSTQRIGCAVWGWSSNQAYMGCWALDSAGNYASCTSGVASIITAVTAATDGAYFDFQWDASGNCTYVDVYNTSIYTPPTP